MNIDWITLSIWLVGFVIWIVWIIVPAMEFMKIWRSRKLEKPSEKDDHGAD